MEGGILVPTPPFHIAPNINSSFSFSFFSFLLLCLLHRIHKRALNISKSWCSPFTLFHLIPSQGKPGGDQNSMKLPYAAKRIHCGPFLSTVFFHGPQPIGAPFCPIPLGRCLDIKGKRREHYPWLKIVMWTVSFLCFLLNPDSTFIILSRLPSFNPNAFH